MAWPGAAGSPGLVAHPLSYVRQQRNWTYQDLVDVIARRLNTAARREKAWRWENRGVVPDADTQLALAAELGVPAERVHSAGWPHWLPIGDGIDVHRPWTVDDGVRILREAVGGAMLDRRAFLILSVGAAATLATDWLTVEQPDVAAVLRDRRVDPSLVGYLEQRLPGLRGLDATLGGGHIRELVDTELHLVTDLLSDGSYSERTGRRLLGVAAELGRLAGWASFDAGYQAAAQRYWTAALRAAHAAHDRGTGANILKSMSLQSMDNDRPEEALGLARTALEGARRMPARVRAMLTVRVARALAVRGEATGCEQHLAAAETLMDHADAQTAPAWASYFDQAEYCAQVAACYLLLRRHQATDHWLTQSLLLQPDERRRDRATYLLWRAASLLELGEVEQTCVLVEQALPDLTAARSVRNRRRLHDLRTELVPHRAVSAVRQLEERIHDLAVAPAHQVAV
jgi:transcriptional regulator with XRE-family HTH domain